MKVGDSVIWLINSKYGIVVGTSSYFIEVFVWEDEAYYQIKRKNLEVDEESW